MVCRVRTRLGTWYYEWRVWWHSSKISKMLWKWMSSTALFKLHLLLIFDPLKSKLSFLQSWSVVALPEIARLSLWAKYLGLMWWCPAAFIPSRRNDQHSQTHLRGREYCLFSVAKWKTAVMEIVNSQFLGQEKYVWKSGTVSHQEGMARWAVAQLQSCLSLQLVGRILSPMPYSRVTYLLGSLKLLSHARDLHKTEKNNSVLLKKVSRGFVSPILEEAVKCLKCQWSI